MMYYVVPSRPFHRARMSALPRQPLNLVAASGRHCRSSCARAKLVAGPLVMSRRNRAELRRSTTAVKRSPRRRFE